MSTKKVSGSRSSINGHLIWPPSRILLTGGGKFADRVDSLQASTYNLENGKVVETRLNPVDIFRDTLKRIV